VSPFVRPARKILALALMFLLACSLTRNSAFARPANGPGDRVGNATRLREQVAHLRAGELIEVRLVNRERVHGRLGAVESDGFSLKLQDRSALERHVAFAELKAVKTMEGTRGRVAGWIVAGVLVGAVVVALAIYLTFRHNEGV
jgi:hypothetical protein